MFKNDYTFTKEEKMAVEKLRKFAFDFKDIKEISELDAQILYYLILDMQSEIKEINEILDTYDNRKFRKKYIKERQKEEPDLLYPDSDEIYERFFEQQKIIKVFKDTFKKLDKFLNKQ